MARDSAFQAWVEVLPDFSGFNSKATSGINSGLGSAGSSGALAFGSSFRSGVGQIFAGSFLADIAASFARNVGEIIGTGIRAGISYGLDSVQLASDLSETKQAITQVFGDASQDIIAFAATANQKLGQTQQSALLGAQTFGVFARSAGLTGKPLTQFSTDLVNLSGDLASFYNADPSEVIQALGAGLRGESEPLRRFGVLLDDATLKAQALTLGIYDGNGSLTQQQRILAAQAEIFAQTGIAQGDFARTSDGLANQQRILQASLEDTQVKLGEALLPAFTELAQFANESLVPALGGVLENVGPKLADALEKAAPKVEELAEKLTPLVEGFITSVAEDGIPAFIDLMGEIAEEAPGWIDAFNQADQAVRDLDSGFQDFQDGLKGAREDRIAWFASFVDDVNGWANPVNDAVNTFISYAFLGPFNELPEKARGVGHDTASGFARGIHEGKGEAIEAAGNMAAQALARARAVLDSHSPSRKFAELGAFSAAGYAEGLVGGTADVIRATENMLGIPGLASVPSGTLAVAATESVGAPGATSGATVRDVHFHTEDPTVAYQMFKQELGGRLATS